VEISFAVFEPFFVASFVASAVKPGFDSFSVLFVVEPVSDLLAAVFAVVISAESVCFVVQPLSVLLVSFGVQEFTHPTRTVSEPLSFLDAVVIPENGAESVFVAVRVHQSRVGRFGLVDGVVADEVFHKLEFDLRHRVDINLFGFLELADDTVPLLLDFVEAHIGVAHALPLDFGHSNELDFLHARRLLIQYLFSKAVAVGLSVGVGRKKLWVLLTMLRVRVRLLCVGLHRGRTVVLGKSFIRGFLWTPRLFNCVLECFRIVRPLDCSSLS